MLRRLAAYLLIVAILAGNFTTAFIYAGFQVNRNYIAEKLCVNRDKPVMQCNGKCYLAKKIRQAEEKEKSGEQQSEKSRLQEAMITEQLRLGKRYAFELRHRFPEQQPPVRHIAHSVFHPPQV